MEGTKELITTDDIRSKVYIIRGQQVMLDKDLAEIYGYEVKKLNQQVKRIFLLDRKADVDIYHTHLLSKEFICLRQFFVEN